MSTPVLEVVGVSKRYGATLALNEASFAVEPGTVHALVGENGAGKSTLVKILSGTVAPDAGTVSLAGQPARLRSARDALAEGVSTAYQELTLVPHLTVAENLLLGREPANRARLTSTSRLVGAAEQVLQEWDLGDVDPEALVSDLSLGVRQQVELVRALSRGGRLLLLDEPTAALGAPQVEWLFRQVRRVRQHEGTVVFISHRMGEIREIASRVTVLRNGRDVGTFGTDEATDEQVVELMLGHAADAQTRQRQGKVATGGQPVLEVRSLRVEPGLREATLDVRAGEVLGVAALQGHGQWELFMALFGARRPAGGQLLIDGRAAKMRSPHDAVHRGLGINLVPEDRKAEGVMLDMSSLANITLPHLSRFATGGLLSSRRERRAALEVCRTVNVRRTALDEEVSALSGGNQQKIAIGKWLVVGSRLLLLYDPTRGVDVGTKAEIFAMMHDFADHGRGIVFYSTDIEELLGVSDRIVVLYRGAVTAELAGAQMTRSAVLSAMLGINRPDSETVPTPHVEGTIR